MIRSEYGNITLGVLAHKDIKPEDIPIELKEAEFYADLTTIFEGLNEHIGKESAIRVVIRSIEYTYGKELGLR